MTSFTLKKGQPKKFGGCQKASKRVEMLKKTTKNSTKTFLASQRSESILPINT